MEKIFALIFAAGFILYIACAILIKVDEHRCFKKAKEFNSDKIIDRFMDENKKFSKNCKPSQHLFVICEVIGGIGWLLIEGYNNLIIQPNLITKFFSLIVILLFMVLFIIFIFEQLYIIKEMF